MSNKGLGESDISAFAGTQRGVAAGMAAGLLASLAFVTLGVAILPSPVPEEATAADALSAILPWLAVLALPLTGGVAAVAAQRFFDPAAMEVRETEANRRLTDAKAFLQNTVEQTLMASLSSVALTASLPHRWLAVVPLLAVWFVFARIAFRIGQPRGAVARSFGFAASFYPSVLGLIAAILSMVVSATS